MSQFVALRAILDDHYSKREALLQKLEDQERIIKETKQEYSGVMQGILGHDAREFPDDRMADQEVFIENLPNEVLMQIFRLVCVDMSDFHTGDVGAQNPHIPAIDISLVSSRWRSLCQNQSELWATIGVRIIRREHKHQRSMLSNYIARSEGQCLNLWFAFEDCNLDETESILIRDSLVHAHRIGLLALFFEGESSPNNTIDLVLNSNLPCLKSLEVYVASGAGNLGPRFPLSDSIQLPGLRHLRSDAGILRKLPHGDWLSQLTTIQMEQPQSDYDSQPWSLLTAILRLPALVNLSIAGPLFDEGRQPFGNPSPTSPLVVRSLRHFRCSDSNVAEYMWTDFTFPHLELLQLQDIQLAAQVYPSNYENAHPGQTLPALAPSLRTLVIVNCSTGSLRFLSFAIPQVNNLIVVDHTSYDWDMGDVFGRLVGHTNRTFWPDLGAATYICGSKKPPIYNPKVFLDFLESQLTADFKLKVRIENLILMREEHAKIWNELKSNRGFEELGRDSKAIIPWPRTHNFFSNQSESVFNP